MSITPGMNCRKALKIAKKLGVTIVPVRRHGELKLKHPALNRMMVISTPGHRKDSPRALTTWLKQLVTALAL